jgi:hypothetical protein
MMIATVTRIIAFTVIVSSSSSSSSSRHAPPLHHPLLPQQLRANVVLRMNYDLQKGFSVEFLSRHLYVRRGDGALRPACTVTRDGWGR